MGARAGTLCCAHLGEVFGVEMYPLAWNCMFVQPEFLLGLSMWLLSFHVSPW